MVKVAFFGHNSNEPAVQRRARFFKLAGIDVIGVMPHRGPLRPTDFELLSLGETVDTKYIYRLKTLFKSLALSPGRDPRLQEIDVLYARNLDMLICAHGFRRRNRLDIPIVYECLDIHALMVGDRVFGKLLRWVEGALLKRSDMLVYSSDCYVSAYFDVHHPGQYKKRLVENRINPADVQARPKDRSHAGRHGLKLGWIGNLRCRKSLDLLKQLGTEFSPALSIEIHGYPAPTVFPDFEQEIKDAPGLTYHGRYNNMTDLADIYNGVDVVWASDWFEADHNSVWQLPNRIYEGGYFGVPAITAQGTETADKIGTWNAGWEFQNPAETTVPALIRDLLSNPDVVEEKRQALFDLPVTTFVETPDETRAIIAQALSKD